MPPKPSTFVSTWLPRAGWALLFAAIVAFYCWTATSSHGPFDWSHEPADDHFNHLTDAYLAGQLSLLIQPAPELLALKDPRDPRANAPYRLQDASLYKGKYYLYFGPVPVLTSYLPWRVLTHVPLPTSAAAVLYASAGFVFSCLLLLLLLRTAGVRPHWILIGLSCAALGLAQVAPIVLRRTAVYEISIASGYCFFLAALYFLALSVLTGGRPRWLTWMAGALLGLTLGCRPHFVVAAAVVCVFYLVYLFRTRGLRGLPLVAELLRFSAPIAICGVLILWYNYARFDNPLEFGVNYALSSSDANSSVRLSPASLRPGLFFLLAKTYDLTHRFPYLKFSFPNPPLGHQDWLPANYYIEPVAGLLPLGPLFLVGLLAPVFYRWRRLWANSALTMILATTYAAAVTLLVCVCLTGWVSMRYSLDFAPAFLVLSLFFALFFIGRIRARRLRLACNALLSLLCLWGITTNLSLSINGYQDDLTTRNPRLFSRLAMFFGQKGQSPQRQIASLDVEAGLVFPGPQRAKTDVLLSTGYPYMRNIVYLEYLGGNIFKFSYDCFGEGGTSSKEKHFVPGREYALEIHYNADAGRLTVTLDGATMLDQPTHFHPTAPEEIILGRDGFGGLFGDPRFFAELRHVRRSVTYRTP